MQVRRPVIAFAAAIAACAVWSWAAQGAAESPPAPAAPAGVNVEVERLDQTKVTGVFTAKTLPLQEEFGVVNLDVVKVKRVDTVPPDEADAAGRIGIPANVLLMKGEHLNGPLLLDAIEVTPPGGETVRVPLAEVARITFLHPKDHSLLAAAIALLTLTMMEIVLGVDNVIFLVILAGKLPEAQRPRARTIGLAAALGTRLILLFFLSTLMGLTRPVFVLPHLPFLGTFEARGISWRDIVLLAGGLFLIGKSVYEMHEKVEEAGHETDAKPTRSSFARVILMMAIFDIIFSLDSVITAVGMVEDLWVMVTAMVLAMFVMLGFAGPINRFVDNHPTIKVLALSFLVLIGVILVAEGLGQHINKGYIYFAMAFAVAVEVVNIQLRGKHPIPTLEKAAGVAA
jgi:predicted tellurium resistance membrane protein TerC